MHQGNALPCSCIGTFFNPQQKLFLSRKKEVEETEPFSSRKSNKSTELKHQGQVKQKKSLKKRTLSNLSVETPPSPFQCSQQLDTDLKINLNHHDLSNRKDYGQSRMVQSPNNQAKIHFNKPINMHVHTFQDDFKQKSYNKLWQQKNYRPTTPRMLPESFPHYSIQTPPPTRTQADFSNTQYLQAQNHQFYRVPQRPSHFSHSPPEEYDQKHIQKMHFNKETHKETQSWMDIKNEELLIQQFDSFFKSKKEKQSYANLTNPNHSLLQPQEPQLFKTFQKPQLMGRFAQSDDQCCSQSSPSQVIGKGFDSTFHEFWEGEQSTNAKETFASRSTNTKFSQLNKHDSEQRPRPQFGTVNSFKSYKYL